MQKLMSLIVVLIFGTAAKLYCILCISDENCFKWEMQACIL